MAVDVGGASFGVDIRADPIGAAVPLVTTARIISFSQVSVVTGSGVAMTSRPPAAR